MLPPWKHTTAQRRDYKMAGYFILCPKKHMQTRARRARGNTVISFEGESNHIGQCALSQTDRHSAHLRGITQRNHKNHTRLGALSHTCRYSAHLREGDVPPDEAIHGDDAHVHANDEVSQEEPAIHNGVVHPAAGNTSMHAYPYDCRSINKAPAMDSEHKWSASNDCRAYMKPQQRMLRVNGAPRSMMGASP
eukprot:scaffold292357_cov23-Tisochrysis_lutea.AAC.1